MYYSKAFAFSFSMTSQGYNKWNSKYSQSQGSCPTNLLAPKNFHQTHHINKRSHSLMVETSSSTLTERGNLFLSEGEKVMAITWNSKLSKDFYPKQQKAKPNITNVTRINNSRKQFFVFLQIFVTFCLYFAFLPTFIFWTLVKLLPYTNFATLVITHSMYLSTIMGRKA